VSLKLNTTQKFLKISEQKIVTWCQALTSGMEDSPTLQINSLKLLQLVKWHNVMQQVNNPNISL